MTIETEVAAMKKAQMHRVPINSPHRACDLWTGAPLAKRTDCDEDRSATGTDGDTFKLTPDTGGKRRASFRMKRGKKSLQGAPVGADDEDAAGTIDDVSPCDDDDDSDECSMTLSAGAWAKVKTGVLNHASVKNGKVMLRDSRSDDSEFPKFERMAKADGEGRDAFVDWRKMQAAQALDPSKVTKAGSMFDTHAERLTKNQALARLTVWADTYSNVIIGDRVVDPIDAIKATHLRAPRKMMF